MIACAVVFSSDEQRAKVNVHIITDKTERMRVVLK